MELRDMLVELDGRKESLHKARPFCDYELRQIKEFFRSENVWSSNALEGNTITLEETRIILEDGVTVGGHTLKELDEVVGGGRGYDAMFAMMKDPSKDLDGTYVKGLHSLFASNDPSIQPGEYRNLDVIVTGAEHVPPGHEEVPALMEDFFEWYDEAKKSLHPVVLAADAHIRFVGIHPFVDGNGRVSRLIANTILLKNGFLPMAVPPIRKREYCRNLDKAHMTGDFVPFREFIAEMSLMTMRDYMRMLRVSYHQH